MAESVLTQMEDALTRHQVFILRLEAGQATEMNDTIDESIPELVGALTLWLRGARKGQQVTLAQDAQYAVLERQVSRIRGTSITKAQAAYILTLLALVEHEIEYAEGLFRDIIPVRLKYAVPDADKVGQRLVTTASYEGLTVEEWFAGLAAADLARIMSTVRFGMTQGIPNQDIITSVVGSKEFGFTDGATNVTRNSAKTLVRTVTNGVAGDARSTFYRSNDDILTVERYTAILDGRTSLICISLDGTIVKIGHGPRSPQHRNCRSYMVPIVTGQSMADALGERPFVRDSRTKRMRQIDFRKEARDKAGKTWSTLTPKQRTNALNKIRRNWLRDNVGVISEPMTYEDWLKRQPVAFQNEVLGRGRAKLWRAGKIDAGDFLGRSGKTLTLDELRKLEN